MKACLVAALVCLAVPASRAQQLPREPTQDAQRSRPPAASSPSTGQNQPSMERARSQKAPLQSAPTPSRAASSPGTPGLGLCDGG